MKLLVLIKYHINNNEQLHEIKKIHEIICQLYNIDLFFIINNINQDSNFTLKNNILFIKKVENYWEALLEKVILGIKYFEKDDYTDIFVGNISTFLNIPELLKECNKEFNIKSTTCWDNDFNNKCNRQITGAGYLIKKEFGKKLCKFILEDDFNIKTEIWEKYPTTDDMCISYVCDELNIQIKEIKSTNIYDKEDNTELMHLKKNLSKYKDANVIPVIFKKNNIDKYCCFYRINFKYGDRSRELEIWNYMYDYIYNKNIFTYWAGNKFKLLVLLEDLMLENSKKNNYNLILLNDKNIKKYIDVPLKFTHFKLNHQSDIVRTRIIYKYGGIWLDSDTLIIENLDYYFNIIDNYNSFFTLQDEIIVCSGFFGCKRNNLFVNKWLKLSRKNDKWKN